MAGNDSSALELEIDKEIDSLFVPTGRGADKEAIAAESTVRPGDGEVRRSPKPAINPDAVLLETGEGLAGNDSSALELEIDREIDSLFVPTGSRAEVEAVPVAPPGQPHRQPPDARKTAIKLDDAQLEIDREIDRLFVPAGQADSTSATSISPERLDHSAGLSGLIEQFNAAYLSLDWEFSRENLKKFIDALQQLEPMASRSSDSKSVFKILDVILKRLFDRPYAVNSKLVQLIRESQGLLAHMLLIEGKSGQHEKQRLKELVEKFQDLRKKAIAAKAGSPGPERSTALPGKAAPSPSRIPRQVAGDVSPSVLPATAHSAEKAPPGEQKEKAARGIIPDPREKTDAARPGIRNADTCLLVSRGKWFSLPASSVIKAARATGRTGRKVLKRGYATLSDFKPLLGSVKNGVLGQWAEWDLKELGSYRFEPLGFDLATGPIATGPIAVLASDGQTHRIIFCDAANFILAAEIADPSPAADGLFRTRSHAMVPFIDLRGLPASQQTAAKIQKKI